MTHARITHIGGPTALLEFAGWRILTDPTFDPAGKRYFFGWGTTSKKTRGPSHTPAGIARPLPGRLTHRTSDTSSIWTTLQT